MHLAVDARPIDGSLTPQSSGIAVYTRMLVDALHNTDSLKLSLLTTGDPAQTYRPDPQVTVRGAGVRSAIASTLVSQTRFGRWARDLSADAYWSPRHHLPVGLACPSVVTIHDLVWRHAGATMPSARRRLDHWLMGRAVRVANRIIVPSQATYADLVAWRPNIANKTRVIPLAGRFVPDDGSRQPPLTEPYFLCVAANEPRKNLSRLLRAYAQLQESRPIPAKLVLAGGEGWLERPIAEQVASLGLTEHVICRHDVADEELATWYRHCLFVVLPSLHEGFGLPLVEGMSFSKALLCSNRSALPEVAADAALYIDPESVDSIADGLTQLVENSTLRSNLALASKQRGAHFTWSLVAAETLQVLRELAPLKACAHR